MKKLVAAIQPSLLVCLAFLSVAQPFTALAQTTAPAPLPPAAQEALDKGIIAAKVPDYLLAIRFFEDARKIAPDAPIIYLNLGLAESKIPGRELRAIAFFGAYLAAAPNAQNAAAARQQIAVLEVRNQSNLSRFIKSIEHPPTQTTSPNELRYTVSQINLVNIRNIAMLWAKAGDIAAALKAVELIKGDDAYGARIYRSEARRAIVEAHIEAGDIGAAGKTAALLQENGDKAAAQKVVADAQTHVRVKPATVGDWIERLDDNDDHIDHHDCALNSGPFLNLADYLNSLPKSDTSQSAIDSSFKTAWTLATAQSIIKQMLKLQAKQ